MHRSYIGTYIYEAQDRWRNVRLSNRLEILTRLTDPQRTWLEKNAPQWKYWRDEFRPTHYHIYSETPISDRNVTLLGILFYRERPSHFPIGEEKLWSESFKD